MIVIGADTHKPNHMLSRWTGRPALYASGARTREGAPRPASEP